MDGVIGWFVSYNGGMNDIYLDEVMLLIDDIFYIVLLIFEGLYRLWNVL